MIAPTGYFHAIDKVFWKVLPDAAGHVLGADHRSVEPGHAEERLLEDRGFVVAVKADNVGLLDLDLKNAGERFWPVSV